MDPILWIYSLHRGHDGRASTDPPIPFLGHQLTCLVTQCRCGDELGRLLGAGAGDLVL